MFGRKSRHHCHDICSNQSTASLSLSINQNRFKTPSNSTKKHQFLAEFPDLYSLATKLVEKKKKMQQRKERKIERDTVDKERTSCACVDIEEEDRWARGRIWMGWCHVSVLEMAGRIRVKALKQLEFYQQCFIVRQILFIFFKIFFIFLFLRIQAYS